MLSDKLFVHEHRVHRFVTLLRHVMAPKKPRQPAQILPLITRSVSASDTPIIDQLNDSHTSDDNNGGLSEEGRIIFAMLMKKLDTIVDELKIKTERLELAEQENTALRSRLSKLEDRVEFLETKERGSNLILSGKALSSLNNDNLIQSATVFLKKTMNYELNSDKIATASRLGPKPTTQAADTRKLMIGFRDKGDRNDVLFTCKRSRPTNLYANEDLTPHKSHILYVVRQMKDKSNGKIVACGSMNGRIYALIAPPNQSGKPQRVFLDSLDKLDELCQRELDITSSSSARNERRRM